MTPTVYKVDGGRFPLDEGALKRFHAAGIDLVERACEGEDAIVATCREADAILVTADRITDRVMAALPRLKVLARCGVGVDSIDVAAATRRGIQVTNVPDANIVEVATHAIAMALALTRRLVPSHADLIRGAWSREARDADLRRPSAQTFGIVGFGRIGEKVAGLAGAMGFRVAVATPVEREQEWARDAGAEPMPFTELVRESDVLSLHVPLIDSTANLIDEAVIGAMKPGSFLINVSRGGLVDEAALARALASGHLAGAALDVFLTEPVAAENPLLALPNVILTPHIAYLSRDSMREMSIKMTDEVIAVLAGRPPTYPVNHPAR